MEERRRVGPDLFTRATLSKWDVYQTTSFLGKSEQKHDSLQFLRQAGTQLIFFQKHR